MTYGLLVLLFYYEKHRIDHTQTLSILKSKIHTLLYFLLRVINTTNFKI